jgi:hypothetical protein
MLPLGMLRLLPKPRLLRLRQCWYPTPHRYLYETSKSERVFREGFAGVLCGGSNGSSIRLTPYRLKRCLPKRCRRHLNRPP